MVWEPTVRPTLSSDHHHWHPQRPPPGDGREDDRPVVPPGHYGMQFGLCQWTSLPPRTAEEPWHRLLHWQRPPPRDARGVRCHSPLQTDRDATVAEPVKLYRGRRRRSDSAAFLSMSPPRRLMEGPCPILRPWQRPGPRDERVALRCGRSPSPSSSPQQRHAPVSRSPPSSAEHESPDSAVAMHESRHHFPIRSCSESG